MQRKELRDDDYLAVPRWLLRRRDMTLSQKMVAAEYIEAYGPFNEAAWPGPASVAKSLGMSVSTVDRAIYTNVSAGVMVPGGLSDLGTRVYIIKMTPPQNDPGVKMSPPWGQSESPPGVKVSPKAWDVSKGESKEEEGPAPRPSPIASKVSDSGIQPLPSASTAPASTSSASPSPSSPPAPVTTPSASSSQATPAPESQSAKAAKVKDVTAADVAKWWVTWCDGLRASLSPPLPPLVGVNWKRLGGDLKGLKGEGTWQPVTNLATAILGHWAIIAPRLAWTNGGNLPHPSERMLFHTGFVEAARTVMAMTDDEREAAYAALPAVGGEFAEYVAARTIAADEVDQSDGFENEVGNDNE